MSYQCILITDIFPNKFWTRTVGVYRLATELRARGYRVKVIYGYTDIPPQELRNLLHALIGPDTLWIGYSCSFMEKKPYISSFSGIERSLHLESFESCIPEIKEAWPQIKFLVGGTSAAARVYDFADYYVVGYADEKIVEITDALFRGGEITAEKRHGKPWIDCQHDFSFAKKVTRYTEEDAIFHGECLTLELTRGCRFKCKFCSFPLNGRENNSFWKEAGALRGELLENYERHGITTYILADDTFNESAEKLAYYLEIFESLPFQLQYSSFFRIDLLARQADFHERLLRSGLRGAFFGIESLNPKASAAIGKPLPPSESIQLLRKLRAEWGDEVVVSGGFIAGLPHDTPKTVAAWLETLKDPAFPLHNHHVQPLVIAPAHLPGPWTSEFQKNSAAYGYEMAKIENGPWYWRNDAWDYHAAVAMAGEHNRYMHTQVPSTHDCFTHTILMGYGLSHQEVFALKQAELYSTITIRRLVRDRITEYRQRISGQPLPRRGENYFPDRRIPSHRPLPGIHIGAEDL